MPQFFPDSRSSGKWHHMTWKTKCHFWMELTCPRCDKGWRKSGFNVCWADHWGRETSHKSRFQWYTYMLSSLELTSNHYYLFLRFMSDLYSQGQEPMSNIMESKYPQPIDASFNFLSNRESCAVIFPYCQCHYWFHVPTRVLSSHFSGGQDAVNPIGVGHRTLWPILLTSPLSPSGCEHEQKHSQSNVVAIALGRGGGGSYLMPSISVCHFG